MGVLEVNPGLLVVVEGVEYAGNLEGARHHPIVLSRPRQLVYSGHEYTFWGDTNRPSSSSTWRRGRPLYERPATATPLRTGWAKLEQGAMTTIGARLFVFSRRLMLIGAIGQLMGTRDLERTKVLGFCFLTIRRFATRGL